MKRSFSPSEAAMEGFRLVTSKPGVIAAWALINLLIGAAVIGLFWVILAPDLPSLMEQITAAKSAAQNGANDSMLAAPLLLKMRAVQWIITPFSWLVSMILTAAVYRAVLRPKEGGFAYLRIGADEFRMLAVLFVYVIISIVAIIAIAIIAGIIGTAGYMAFAKNGAGGWFGVAVVVSCIAAFCACVWVWVRLSLALTITFAERRISIFDSWALTRGRFWSMLGCYVLAGIFVIIVELVAVAVLGGLFLLAVSFLAPEFRAGGTPRLAGLTTILIPLGLVWIVVAAALSAVLRTIITAPGAAIYRALKAPDMANVSDDFTAPDVLIL